MQLHKGHLGLVGTRPQNRYRLTNRLIANHQITGVPYEENVMVDRYRQANLPVRINRDVQNAHMCRPTRVVVDGGMGVAPG